MKEILTGEYKISVIPKKYASRRIENTGSFVSIQHIPSSITVTEFGKIQKMALDKANDKINQLIKEWES